LESLDLTLISEQRAVRQVLPADERETKLLDLLTNQPMHVDEISNQVDLPIATVTSTLALMELKGMVRQVGGMQYVAVREIRADYQARKDLE
jgi:DNA processing protein